MLTLAMNNWVKVLNLLEFQKEFRHKQNILQDTALLL
uniref:Uncharacterized protein MANES_03G198800 n=1 Tax=Rhizophora mucronata TaxID=61149 RepID=A0A2P2LDZ7_RHIMU